MTMKMTKEEFVKYVDHSLLKPHLTKEEIIEGLKFAKEVGCASVCINPNNLDYAREYLAGSDVKIGTVIGFPSGAHTTFEKVAETKDAYTNGAVEMDMVIDIGALRNGEYDKVQADIEAVVEAAKDKALVKVIIETALLDNEEIVKACELAKAAGADFVKTSTGFSTGGAVVEDVRLMRETVGPEMGVKASGGIHNEAEAAAMVEAGANRLGTSASVAIVTGSTGAGY